ncbi:MAG: hypothetical protein AMXMBFR84_51370 [Candidatus Hydrogenedentota bacterium]
MAINQQSKRVLRDLADYRILSTSHIAHLYGRGRRSARGTMDSLCKRGYAEPLPGYSGENGGRPENVFGLSKAGHRLLIDEGVIPESVPYDAASGDALMKEIHHQMLLNSTRIHLEFACRHLTHLECHFLAANSPFTWNPDDGASIVREEVVLPENGRTKGLVPDAALLLKHRRSSEAVLFFLEVDMGSEPFTRSDNGQSNIHDKVERYKIYFRSGQYKTKYEARWSVPLRGFRTLFLAVDQGRARQLVNHLATQRPSGFCWVTDKDQMDERGISGKIWLTGDNSEQPESIFDHYAADLPLPALRD